MRGGSVKDGKTGAFGSIILGSDSVCAGTLIVLDLTNDSFIISGFPTPISRLMFHFFLESTRI